MNSLLIALSLTLAFSPDAVARSLDRDSEAPVASSKAQTADAQSQNIENEFEALSEQKENMKTEIATASEETLTAQKRLRDDQEKLEKLKSEVQALKQSRSEMNKKLLKIASEDDMVVLDQKSLLREKSQLQPQAPVAAAVTPPVTPTPAQNLQRKISSTPARPAVPVAANAALTLKKDCRVFESPDEYTNLLGVKFSGTYVIKIEEDENWVGFSFDGGQRGYLEKSCF